MSVETHIIKVSFCDTFQKAVKPKRSYDSFSCTIIINVLLIISNEKLSQHNVAHLPIVNNDTFTHLTNVLLGICEIGFIICIL